MKEKFYRIKPLEWKKVDGIDRWMASTPERWYSVEVDQSAGGWFLEYMICERIVDVPCSDLAHGQQLAQSHYERRLMAALEPVEEK